MFLHIIICIAGVGKLQPLGGYGLPVRPNVSTSFKVLLVSFVSERGLKGFQKFSDEVWLCRFCFFTDISSHLNELNLKLLITNMGPRAGILSEADAVGETAVQERLRPFPSPRTV